MKKKVLPFFVLFEFFGISQTYDWNIVKINYNILTYDWTQLDSNVLKLDKETMFYYYPSTNQLFTTNDDEYYCSNPQYLEILENEKFIKFKYSVEDIPELTDEEIDWCTENNIGYSTIIHNAAIKRKGSFVRLIGLEKMISQTGGSIVEPYYGRVFKIIHFWNDNELINLIKENDPIFLKSLKRIFLEPFFSPFSPKNSKEYFTEYFPLLSQEVY